MGTATGADVPHVVVIGAGFGGLTVARRLARAARRQPLRVTVVDRHNHHTFQPLLYQVATSGLQPQDVGHPLRPILARRRRRTPAGVNVRLAEATRIDRDRHAVLLDDGSTLGYDRLIIAAGGETNDFGVPGVEEHTFSLKSVRDAIELRDHILRRFEAATTAAGDDRRALLTFVITGGGPTGVELAGALAELVDHVLLPDHPNIDRREVSIVLLEMADRLLGGFRDRSSRYAERELRERGVDIQLGATVAAIDPDGVRLANGARLRAGTVVWVAGIRPVSLAATVGSPQTPDGRLVVDDMLRLPDDPDVHVVGDMAAVENEDGHLLPQLAPVAIQQGRHVARQLALRLEGRRPRQAFRFRDKGTMATMGRGDAVAELPFGGWVGGTPGWLAWLALHLLYLIGFRNRVAVLFSWVWNYLTYDRSSRLILHGEPRTDVPPTRHEGRSSGGERSA